MEHLGDSDEAYLNVKNLGNLHTTFVFILTEGNES